MNIQGNTLVRGVNQPHVVIPEGVEIIGPDAFSQYDLTSIIFPSTLTSIGERAFHGCIGLTSVDLSATRLTIIQQFTFAGSGLTSVKFPSTLTHIRSAAFSQCTRLTSVTFSEGLTSIGEYAFYKCYPLTSIIFPSTLTGIGASAFSSCRLTSVTFPEGLTSIGEHAFYQCYDLTSIIFPSTLNGIGASAFSQCIKLTSVVFPSTRTSIGDKAFFKCTGLVSVDFSSTLTSIGNSAFYGCKRLIVIVPPCRVALNAFTDCSLVINASGSYNPGSIVVDPKIIGLRQRLLALWSQNVRRQGLLRQVHRGYRVALYAVSEGYDTVQSNRERAEVLQLWREIKHVLGPNMRFVGILFRRIIAGGRRFMTMKSYLNQPEEAKVFKRVLEDLGIAEPRRFRNWQGTLESQLRF